LTTSKDIELKLELADDFYKHGKHLHAIQIYRSLLDENPDLIDAYLGLASSYVEIQNPDAAMNIIDSCLELHPDELDIRLYYIPFLLKHSKWEKIIDILSYISPQDEPQILFYLGYANYMLEEYEIAKLNFLGFISLQNDTALLNEAYLYLVKIDLQLGNFKSALTFSRKAEKIYSNYWELNFLNAKIYSALGMETHAKTSIEKAIKLNPREPLLFEFAGNIYFKLSDYLNAEKYFSKYIEQTDNASSDVYTNLAEACLRIEKLKKASEYFDAAIKLDPGNRKAIDRRKHLDTVKKKETSDG
jgi:tetratricopeptide (TPR) repeat protein